MTNTYFLNAFDGYGVGTLLVACLVVAGVWGLKKTLLKDHLQSPFMPYLPFVLGVAVYAVYYCILSLTLNGFLTHVEVVVKDGFTVGCLSTIVSSSLDRITGKTHLAGKALFVRTLLQGFVPDSLLDGTAQKVADCFTADQNSGMGASNAQTEVCAILNEALSSSGSDASYEDVSALARLIEATLRKAG